MQSDLTISAIPALLTDTLTSLTAIWEAVGYSSTEKASQTSSLLVSISSLCASKISEESMVRDQFSHSIASARAAIINTCKALHREVPDAALTDDNTLTLTLTTVTEIVDALNNDARESRSRIQKARDTIINKHAALATTPDAAFLDEDEDLSDKTVAMFEHEAKQVTEATETRLTVIIKLVLDTKTLLTELAVDALSPIDTKILGSLDSTNTSLLTLAATETSVGISGAALEDLTTRLGELTAEKRRRKIRLGELGSEIAGLWEKLHVDEDIQRAFTESVQGLGMDTIMKGEAEVRRLHGLKAQMRGKLVEEARDQILSLWEETNASQSQRAAFTQLNVTDEELFTDELLQEHDEEIAVLVVRLDQMRPILGMIEKREAVVAERAQYEELQKDPERLKQRGGALTKQLMMEEKMSKRIKKDLPKYEEALSKKLKEWKKECGEDFMWKGESYESRMASQEEEWQKYKEGQAAEKLQKKQQEKARYSGVGGSGTSKAGGAKATGKMGKPLVDGRSRENSMN
jgi:protein regulator of cytokinesis 1